MKGVNRNISRLSGISIMVAQSKYAITNHMALHYQPIKTKYNALRKKLRWGRSVSVILISPPEYNTWISFLGGWRDRIRGMLFKIAKPIGKPIMVMFKNQAMAIANAPNHHPIKMNHRTCIRQPGPESLWIVVDDWDGVSIDIMLRNLVLNFISSIVFFRF